MALPSHNFIPDAGLLSASQREDVWHEVVKMAIDIAGKQLDGFTTRLANALLACPAGLSASEVQLRADAAALLKKNRYLFYYTASECLSVALQNEVQSLENLPPALSERPEAKRLAPDLEVDKKLSLIRASRAIDSEHANRLAVLNTRLACMLGRDEMTTAQNPFRPHVFLAALHDAWCEFHPDERAHHLIFRLIGPDLFIDLGTILQAINAALVKHGVMASLVEPQRAASAAAARQENSDNPVTRQLRSLFPEHEQIPGKNDACTSGNALPSLFGEAAMNVAVSRSQFLTYLAEINKNGPEPQQAIGKESETQGAALLAHIKRWAPQGSLSPADANTVDLLIAVFDAVLGIRNMPAEIKTLIGSLQIPLLKATLNDKDFFFRPIHPARRAIDLMAQLGVSWNRVSGPRDPLYQTILRNVKRIQSDHRIPSFSEAVTELESALSDQEAGTAHNLPVSIAQAMEQEKRLQATKAAKQEVALRVGTGEVVAFVEAFLEDKWVSVLTLAYTVKDDKPQALSSAIKTMDELCWSVKPKITMEERKSLLAKLPNIIAALNKWLDLIKWDDDARVKFFDDLAKCHASIVRAPLELSPERQLQIALAVAKKATERRLQRQANRQSEPMLDAFDETVQKLARGAWVEFVREGSAAMKVKLAWVSPMRSLYIFSTQGSQEALSISGQALAQALREGRAQIVLEAGLVARALEDALAVGGANSDVIDRQSAA